MIRKFVVLMFSANWDQDFLAYPPRLGGMTTAESMKYDKEGDLLRPEDYLTPKMRLEAVRS